MNTGISIVIPTYRKDIFLKNFSRNEPFLNLYEVVVVNDNPQSSLRKDLQQIPNVKLIENTKNSGFAVSVNNGIHEATGRYVMLLNDDVILTDNSFLMAIDRLKKDAKLFAVSFAQTEKDKTVVGKNVLFWKNGFIHHEKSRDMKSGRNAWAEGGACMIDKSKYDSIGGFDTMFSPFYWEDVDLSYRAYCHGFHVYFDSSIKVIHHHESTIGNTMTRDQIASIAFRNQLLFIWKNINDPKLFGEHLIRLVPTVVSGGIPFLLGFSRAVPRIFGILIGRNNKKLVTSIINGKKLKLP